MSEMNEVLELINNGYSVHPLVNGGKEPLLNGFLEIRATEMDVRSWISKTCNFGVICEDMAAVDIDNDPDARSFYRNYKGILKTIVKTRRGIHAYFQNPGVGNRQTPEWDLRGHGGYVVAAGSVVKGWKYSYVDGHPLVRPEELPALPERFTVKTSKTRTKPGKIINNSIKYIRKIHAVSGDGGHNATFRAACKLRDSGMGEAEALAAMIEWNKTNCDPPWTTKDLLHKVCSAYERS